MLRTSIRKLGATATVAALTLAGLTFSLTPAQAATTTPPPSSTVTQVTTLNVPDMRHAVREVLASRDASSAWPAVDADLTPRLNDTVAAGGGTVLSEVLSLPFKIKIKCTITFPPLQITCTIEIDLFGASPAPPRATAEVTAFSVPETREAVSDALTANGASRAWPAVDADLTPRLNDTVAAGGGDVLSAVIALPFKIKIKCTITFPPLKIHCTIEIDF